MWLFRRKLKVEHNGGSIIVNAAAEHRCVPPGAHEWPAGDWKVDERRKYPEGTVWRCPCGDAWRSGRYPPRFGSPSVSLGMWLNWYRDPRHDAVCGERDDPTRSDQ